MIKVKTLAMHYFDTQTGERVLKEYEYFACSACHSYINDDAIYCMNCGEEKTPIDATVYRADGLELTEEQYDMIKSKSNGKDAKKEVEKIKKDKEIEMEKKNANNM